MTQYINSCIKLRIYYSESSDWIFPVWYVSENPARETARVVVNWDIFMATRTAAAMNIIKY